MVRRLVLGLVAVLSLVGAGTLTALANADASQAPAGEFVKCPAGDTCLAPAVVVERD